MCLGTENSTMLLLGTCRINEESTLIVRAKREGQRLEIHQVNGSIPTLVEICIVEAPIQCLAVTSSLGSPSESFMVIMYASTTAIYTKTLAYSDQSTTTIVRVTSHDHCCSITDVKEVIYLPHWQRFLLVIEREHVFASLLVSKPMVFAADSLEIESNPLIINTGLNRTYASFAPEVCSVEQLLYLTHTVESQGESKSSDGIDAVAILWRSAYTGMLSLSYMTFESYDATANDTTTTTTCGKVSVQYDINLSTDTAVVATCGQYLALAVMRTEGSDHKSSVAIYDGNGSVAMLEDIGCPYPAVEENISSSSSNSILQHNNHSHGCSADQSTNDRTICGLCLYEIGGSSKTVNRLSLLVSLFNGHYWRYEIHLTQVANRVKPLSRLLYDNDPSITQSVSNEVTAAATANNHQNR